ncbi:DnaB-like helicase C-terminal domain-containing protein [Acinetobacter brisouii]|uniref:DnaB-like helicase C-terminal domain-containing protein n=1 Tax=Acinetobacter brisouii TaxID=396323 RepID=UPI00124E2EEA|nr:DnaB-like helicase C-terminal domain-containing protein [Acinetobacter brisouii]
MSEEAKETGATVEQFEFDGEFQTKVAALAIRDNEFLRRTSNVLRPGYFENVGEAKLVELSLRHFDKYNCAPDRASLIALVKDAVTAKMVSSEVIPTLKEAIKSVYASDMSNRDFVEEKVVAFAKKQAMIHAIIKSAEMIGRGNYSKVEALISEANAVGAAEGGTSYDFFSKDRITERTIVRVEKELGARPPQGITTGDPRLDNLLYHRGWGRKELSALMGGAKAGKTTALINFSKAASLAGFNVLYCTLEVGASIIADRMDASISGTIMKELGSKAHAVKDALNKLEASGKTGKLILHEYASGTFSPNQLRQLVQRYKSPARNQDGSVRNPIIFDLIVVDYADIMAPNHRTNDPMENSKSVYIDLRAIAFEENAAVLTATQTNREGFKSAVAKAEHVADDFNKVRTVDLMISINKTEEEAARGEARLYFAASRNQESGFTVVVKQNLSMMRFIEGVIRVE